MNEYPNYPPADDPIRREWRKRRSGEAFYEWKARLKRDDIRWAEQEEKRIQHEERLERERIDRLRKEAISRSRRYNILEHIRKREAVRRPGHSGILECPCCGETIRIEATAKILVEHIEDRYIPSYLASNGIAIVLDRVEAKPTNGRSDDGREAGERRGERG